VILCFHENVNPVEPNGGACLKDFTSGAPVHDSGEPGQLDPRYLPRIRPINTMRGKTIR
jgi:hypothetical protein